ncbi:MAG: sulfurtransferase TusA family protein [Candidatus Aminicenantes bacterium]|nr:sulfurtransferase TusA family protein [Candidatus Aminicenantes bacterium]
MSYQVEATKTLDCVGLYCPEPLFQTREQIDTIDPGDVLEIIADDPAAEEDLKRFAKRTGNELLFFEKNGDIFRFLLKKGTDE